MATNEPWNLKPALIRSGKVDRIIYVPPPDREARAQIFHIHASCEMLGEDADFEKLAELTGPKEGWHYSGSDIANICNTAKAMAVREAVKGKRRKLDTSFFLAALKVVPPSIPPTMLKRYAEWGKAHASLIE